MHQRRLQVFPHRALSLRLVFDVRERFSAPELLEQSARFREYATRYLANLVEKHNLPPKILVVHRFTPHGVTNARKIELDPRNPALIKTHWGGGYSFTAKVDPA